uniref:Putative secreted protein n=1 Tax=Anopheles darlingi TaxID=43151 RepID=A0A2M4D089_ANODA
MIHDGRNLDAGLTESHVIIGFLWLLFLLLLLLLSGGRGSTASTGSDAGADARDQALDIDTLQSLGEQARPVRLDVDTGGFQDGRDLLVRYGNIIINEDQCRVNTG